MYNKTKSIEIHGLSIDSVPYCEAKGLANCFNAYAEYVPTNFVGIEAIGFNENSGYVYIALENGISICSMLGREVEYLVTNFDNGEEHFFDTYHEAETFDPHESFEA